MNILLRRDLFAGDCTIGEMSIDGTFECYTLEDTVRADGVKIAGKTAIPKGRYFLDLTFSRRFQKLLPLLLHVPMFEGIRIHTGNTSADTEGCILVGQTREGPSIGGSIKAMNALMPKIVAAHSAGEDVWLTVE